MKIAKKFLLAGACFCVLQQSASAQSEVTFYTSMGDIVVELTDTLTPVTVDSFLSRVNRGFYDATIFHRVIDNFVVQGGDPTGTGSGGTGTTIPDEFHPTLKNDPGTIAMANIGTPNTGDCQFYFNLKANNHLNNKHTVFGKVTTGFNIVQDIGKVATSSDRPVVDVTVDSIRVTKAFIPPANEEEEPPAYIWSFQQDSEIRIYPNPTARILYIDLPSTSTEVTISNASGQTIYSAQASGKLYVDLGKQAAGWYLVRCINKEGVFTQKLILE